MRTTWPSAPRIRALGRLALGSLNSRPLGLAMTRSASVYTGACVDDVPAVLRSMIEHGHLCGSLDDTSCGDSASIAALAADVERTAARKCAVVYDMDALRSTFGACAEAFPKHFVHGLAIKAAPMAFVVREAIAAGLGVEAASFAEAANAVEHGCPPAKCFFDSPAKTLAELRWALELGLTINADNLDELARIDGVLRSRPAGSAACASTIGLRVNPIIDGGEVDIFAVSSPDSKFGHALRSAADHRAVLDAFAAYPWLSALHVHVGSKGTTIEMLARGAAAVARLADDVDAHCGSRRVRALDIGGGLACSTSSDRAEPTFDEYAAALRAAAPTLFDETRGRAVLTEFGRALVQKSGWIVAQVEYAKPVDAAGADADVAARTAITHAGADLLMRACYNPHIYSHRVSAYDAAGEPLGSARPADAPVSHDLAGPLCFAGDYVRRRVPLPAPLRPGDWCVVHDAGANTLALYSRHCSRLAPPVYSYARDAAGGVRVEQQLAPEGLRSVLGFWGCRK